MINPALIIETALLVLSAYLTGCIAGYVSHRIVHAARARRRVVPPDIAIAPPAEPRRQRSPAARLAASVEELPPPPMPEKPSAKPFVLAAARNGVADNLRQIKGIGPKIEASLHGLGIFHIDQIAGWSDANSAWVDAHLAFRGRIRRERWVEQARELTRARADA